MKEAEYREKIAADRVEILNSKADSFEAKAVENKAELQHAFLKDKVTQDEYKLKRKELHEKTRGLRTYMSEYIRSTPS